MTRKAQSAAQVTTALIFGALLSACASTSSHRSTGETIDDAAISSRIKTALLTDSNTDGIDIELDVSRGQVQLNGFVDSVEESEKAESIARRVKGVTGVSNNLRVAEGSRRFGEYVDDKVLVARVKGALARDPAVNSLSIEVEVNRSVVMLGGFVETEGESLAATAAAKRVKGIREVVNALAIQESTR